VRNRKSIFDLLKPLNIKNVFVYCTVQLFLDTRVTDCKRSGQPRVVRTSQVINPVRSIINQNPVQKQKKIITREMDIAPRTMICIIKQDLELSNDKQDNALPFH
jgi:hypothetical protein